MGWFGGGKKRGASPQRRARTELAPAGLAPRHWTGARAPAAHKPRAERKLLPWQQLGQRALPVLAVALVVGLLVAGWKMLDYVGSVPVSRVLVTGDLRHLDPRLLEQRVRPLLAGEGFMTVDLEKIRTALEELPWVATASIRRRWPDQLVIAVSEQEPIARWGSDGLLNRRGEVFRPQPLGDVAALPELYGPDNLSGEVVEQYAQLRALLAEQQLSIASLGTDARGSWSVTLQNGIELRLGTGDTLKKIRRFLLIYRSDLSRQLEQVKYVDLRYSNGLAVGWKAGGPERG